MTYPQIRDSLQSGDIVEMRGNGIVSIIIRWVCSILRLRFTMFSHIGLVVREGRRILLFEAVPFGVHHVALSEAIKNYNGDVYIRQLKGHRSLKMLGDLRVFMHETQGLPYEKDLLELIGAATPFHLGSADYKDFFCSELVSRVYQLWGLLPYIPIAKEYCPDDYRLGGSVDLALRLFSDSADLNRAYALGPEIPIEKRENFSNFELITYPLFIIYLLGLSKVSNGKEI